jgi:hypothetical protein
VDNGGIQIEALVVRFSRSTLLGSASAVFAALLVLVPSGADAADQKAAGGVLVEAVNKGSAGKKARIGLCSGAHNPRKPSGGARQWIAASLGNFRTGSHQQRSGDALGVRHGAGERDGRRRIGGIDAGVSVRGGALRASVVVECFGQVDSGADEALLRLPEGM